MSEEYISRKSARDILSALAIRHFELSDLYKIYIKALEDADAEILKVPSADVEPVRHGHWIKKSKIQLQGFVVMRMGHLVETDEVFECSECGISYEQEENYCPWCGARMDGEESV